MNTKNSNSQNSQNASNLQAAKQLVLQQNLLNQRIDFWKSLYDASRTLFSILLNTDNRHAYIVPEGIHQSDVDNNEVHFLRHLLIPVKEFISYKIHSLEQKSELIKQIVDD